MSTLQLNLVNLEIMDQSQYSFEFENFNDRKGRQEANLQTAIDRLTYEGLIYATTHYPFSDGRIMVCVVDIDLNEISGKTIGEIKDLLDKKVDERRFPPNRKLEKILP